MFIIANPQDYEKITAFKLRDLPPAEYEQLRNHPQGDRKTGVKGVPEDKLPIDKLQYHFMSRQVDADVIKQAEQDARPIRLEPSNQGLKEYI
jgi:hypothetical protein